MIDPQAHVGADHVLARFFERAQVRGEVSAARLRLVVLVLIAVEVVVANPLASWMAFAPRAWVALIFVLVGMSGSALTMARLREEARLGPVLWTSTTIDTLTVLGVGLPGAIWPRPDYPGQLHFHTLPFLLLCICAAGLRLDVRVVRYAIVINVAAAFTLVGVDAWTDAQVVPNVAQDWILWGAAFLGAGVLGDFLARRTRKMVFDGARAVLDAERARQALGVYVSEEVAAVALRGGELMPGGRRQAVAVLFCDLRGFTRYAEAVAPEQLVEELNDYLGAMVAVVRAEGGVVDKYMGDAVMVVFGIPEPIPDAAARAVRTGLGMVEALARHNEARHARGLPPLRHGIGIHAGEVVVGNIGTPERMQYTVVGDTVNVAARLEEATKDLGGPILISRAAWEAAAAAGAALPPCEGRGSVEVRGRAGAIEVCAPLGG